MIDKINGNGNYDLSSNSSKNKRKNPAVRAYESTPGSKDAAHKRAAEIHKKGSSSKDQEDAGVILDLSDKAAWKKKGAEAVKRKRVSFWPDTLRKLIHPLVQWLKDFWESDRPKEDVKVPDLTEADTQAEEGTESTASEMSLGEAMESAVSEMPSGEAAILEGDLPPLDDGGMIEQFLTRNGAKRLAHNSDLLTYYDRHGKFVEMDETQKHRVLFGDKHVLKL